MKHLKQGLIIQILIIIVALGALGAYFGLDILEFLKKPEVKNVLVGMWNGIKLVWHYITVGFDYIKSLF